MDVPVATRTWQGTGASPGRVTGPARPLRRPEDLVAAGPGEVLVTRHATPMLLPALQDADALVCESAGLLNHAAVLARELGKPCVVGCAGILDALGPGAVLRADGASGLVEVLGPTGAGLGPGPVAAPGPGELVPVLRFGRFTATFERAGAEFGLEAAVRVAALAGVPPAFGVGAAIRPVIDDEAVRVPRGEMDRLVTALTAAVRAGRPHPRAIRRRYDRGIGWSGWTPPPATAEALRAAVGEYLVLNQLTWGAALVREGLGRAYEARLDALLPRDLDGRRELVLDTLARPGLSYISGLGARRGLSGPAAGAGTRARPTATRARPAALRRLAAWLDPGELAELDDALAGLDDLVSLTERKNTDLGRAGAALFADPDGRDRLAAALGTEPDTADEAATERRGEMVATILGRIPPGRLEW